MESYFDNRMRQISEFPAHTPLAMAYVPMQSWEEPYDVMEGFHRATIFPSLDLPFLGREEGHHERKG